MIWPVILQKKYFYYIFIFIFCIFIWLMRLLLISCNYWVYFLLIKVDTCKCYLHTKITFLCRDWNFAPPHRIYRVKEYFGRVQHRRLFISGKKDLYGGLHSAVVHHHLKVEEGGTLTWWIQLLLSFSSIPLIRQPLLSHPC